MQPVLDGQVRPTTVECLFDFKRLADGDSHVNPVKLAAEWDVDHSPPSPAEQAGHPDGPPPTADELDYALVRLADPVGARSWGASSGEGAPVRGWVRVPGAAPALKSPMGMLIAQHPRNQPLELAIDTDALDEAKGLWLNAARTRVRYATNTKGGSSGSPCFDLDWNLIALHNYGDPAFGHLPGYNQGVPIGAIRDRLVRRGIAQVVDSSPPPGYPN
jgi:hypothetical protein